MIKYISFSAIIFLFCLLSISAQNDNSYTTIFPGDSTINTGIIKPYTAKYKLTRNGQFMAWAIVDLSESNYNGKSSYFLRWDLRFPSSSVYDQVIFDKSSLAPYMQILPSGFGNEWGLKITFYNNQKLYGSITLANGDSLKKLEQTFDTKVFEGGMHHLLLSSLPLKKGDLIKFPAGTENGISYTKAEVVDREKRVMKNKAYYVWYVELINNFNNTEMVSNLYLTQQPPYIIKRVAPESIGIEWEFVDLIRVGSYTKQND